jgi:hypothetical protein
VAVSVNASTIEADGAAIDFNTGVLNTGNATIVAAPAASQQTIISSIVVHNRSATAALLQIILFDATNEYQLTSMIQLEAGETLRYGSGGWTILDLRGLPKQNRSLASLGGNNYDFIKAGSTSEGAGLSHGLMFAAGSPGAFTIGTPGLSGRAITSATEPGRLPVQNAVTGKNYISSYSLTASIACWARLIDLMWINSGIVVTTTTAQTINSVTLPARDLNAGTVGLGCVAALLVQTATTNAGAITTITLNFTDSNGVPGVATMPSFPATAAVGTIVPFFFPAGVSGIQSIQSITLGTTLGGGAVSLMIYRPVLAQTCLLANVGQSNYTLEPGIAIENNVCLVPIYLASATSATTLYGSINVMERS